MKNAKYAFWTLVLLLTIYVSYAQPPSPPQPRRLSDKQIEGLLDQIEKKTDDFRDALHKGLKKDEAVPNIPNKDIERFVDKFDRSTEELKDTFNSKETASVDVAQVLQDAHTIDQFMQEHQFRTGADSEWASLKSDLAVLASAYGLSWNRPAGSAPPMRISDREVKQTLDRLNDDASAFEKSLNKSLKESGVDPGALEEAQKATRDLKALSTEIQDRFNDGQPLQSQLTELMRLNEWFASFNKRYPLSEAAQANWTKLQIDLRELGRSFKLPVGR